MEIKNYLRLLLLESRKEFPIKLKVKQKNKYKK